MDGSLLANSTIVGSDAAAARRSDSVDVAPACNGTPGPSSCTTVFVATTSTSIPRLSPFKSAVITVEPVSRAVTAMPACELPAGMMSEVGTAMTDGSLDASVTVVSSAAFTSNKTVSTEVVPTCTRSGNSSRKSVGASTTRT